MKRRDDGSLFFLTGDFMVHHHRPLPSDIFALAARLKYFSNTEQRVEISQGATSKHENYNTRRILERDTIARCNTVAMLSVRLPVHIIVKVRERGTDVS